MNNDLIHEGFLFLLCLVQLRESFGASEMYMFDVFVVTSSIYFFLSFFLFFATGLGTRILIDADTCCYIDLLFKYILSTNYSSILSTSSLYTSKYHPSPTNKKKNISTFQYTKLNYPIIRVYIPSS